MKTDEFELVECETIPTNIDDGKLYYSRKYGTATHLCACGCGSKVVTPCKPGFWDMKILDDGKPTLSPSIGNFQLPCKSHYFIRAGYVVWCPKHLKNRQGSVRRSGREEARRILR